MNTLITQSTEYGEMPIDVYQKLSNDRILFIVDFIDDKLATDIASTLLLKDAEDSESKITLFINADGGDIRSILMLYDMMQMVRAPIETVCMGAAMDEAALLLSSGTKGMRLATKNSLLSINQLVHDGLMIGNLTDAEKMLDQSLADNKKMLEILAKNTGKTLKQVSADFDRRVFMNVSQALKYNLIDKVIAFSKKDACHANAKNNSKKQK